MEIGWKGEGWKTYQHKHSSNEHKRQCRLRHRPLRKRLDIDIRAFLIRLDMPPGERGQQDKSDEGKHDGNDPVTHISMSASPACDWKSVQEHLQQIRKHDHIFERLRDPYQIERILLHTDPLRQSRRIIATQPTSIVIHTDAKVSHPHLQLGVSHDVGNRCCHVGIDLGGRVVGRVGLVVEGYQEDVGDPGRGGGAAGEEEGEKDYGGGDEEHEEVVVAEEGEPSC